MKSNYFLTSLFFVFFCLLTFSCQKDGLIEYSEAIDIKTSKPRNNSTLEDRVPCSEKLIAYIMFRRGHGKETEYSKNSFIKNPKLQAIAYDKMHGFYFGLSIMPDEKARYIIRSCDCKKNDQNIKILEVSQPKVDHSSYRTKDSRSKENNSGKKARKQPDIINPNEIMELWDKVCKYFS